MQINYMKISYKEDVHICHTNFVKKMERNLHETTSRWKRYRKQSFSEDLEVRDVWKRQNRNTLPFELGGYLLELLWKIPFAT
jgi:hypothetical protein